MLMVTIMCSLDLYIITRYAITERKIQVIIMEISQYNVFRREPYRSILITLMAFPDGLELKHLRWLLLANPGFSLIIELATVYLKLLLGSKLGLSVTSS